MDTAIPSIEDSTGGIHTIPVKSKDPIARGIITPDPTPGPEAEQFAATSTREETKASTPSTSSSNEPALNKSPSNEPASKEATSSKSVSSKSVSSKSVSGEPLSSESASNESATSELVANKQTLGQLVSSKLDAFLMKPDASSGGDPTTLNNQTLPDADEEDDENDNDIGRRSEEQQKVVTDVLACSPSDFKGILQVKDVDDVSLPQAALANFTYMAQHAHPEFNDFAKAGKAYASKGYVPVLPPFTNVTDRTKRGCWSARGRIARHRAHRSIRRYLRREKYYRKRKMDQ